MGAGRLRLIRQLITESLAIALAGGALGVVVGYIGIAMLRQIEFPSDLVFLPVIRLDERALTFSLVLAMASAFLFGLAPALQTTRVDLVKSLPPQTNKATAAWLAKADAQLAAKRSLDQLAAYAVNLLGTAR